MASPKTRRNGGDPLTNPPAPPDDAVQVRDAIIVHSTDGGQTFAYMIPPDCQVSPFAWPSVLRKIAERLEEKLSASS